MKCLLLYLLLPYLLFTTVTAQTTTGSMSGRITTPTGEALDGATLTVIHEPMGAVYRIRSRAGGYYNLDNLNPGGPYSIAVSLTGFMTVEKKGIYVSLGNTLEMDVSLSPRLSVLTPVVLRAFRKSTSVANGGIEHLIDNNRIQELPVSGRTLGEYLGYEPYAKWVGEGAIAFAGQNNRYNSFYVDGAIHNDVYGLSPSGTHGGQAGISPVATDAIDQLHILLSPYDAAIGNFTGAGIQAVSKSGSNTAAATVYYRLQNQDLAGKTPAGPAAYASRLKNFSRRNYGYSMGGAIVPSRLFYFFNIDLLRDSQTLPFDMGSYAGTTTEPAAIRGLEATLKSLYRYDPGTFLEHRELTQATRTALRIDWNLGTHHKLTLSNRTAEGLRSAAAGSTASTLSFSNNGYSFPTYTHAISTELKSSIGHHSSNKLLVTHTTTQDDRNPLGSNFPRVRINDGAGAILFGSDHNAAVNQLTQKTWTLLDEYRCNSGKHHWKIGLDLTHTAISNAFIQNSFGTYTYSSMRNFLNQQAPSAYTCSFSLTDSGKGDLTDAAARFSYAAAAVFIQDEYRHDQRLSLYIGLRTDLTQFLTQPAADAFTSDTALPLFAQYWDLQGASAGQKPAIPVSLSPRVGFIYKAARSGLILSGGFGFFAGRIPLAWPGGIYQNNGLSIGTYTATAAELDRIRFRADVNRPWTPAETGGTGSKGSLNLLSADFRLPKLMRTSITVEKKWREDGSAKLELYFTKNLNEISYSNINILPPMGHTSGPDNRAVYPIDNQGRIPFNTAGSNPYDNAILVSNSHTAKGYAYGYSGSVRRFTRRGISYEAIYSYGQSYSTHDGTSSVNLSQWRFTETVNGRNDPQRSVSDFSAGHRLQVFLSRRWSYARKKISTTLSLSYAGESGTPFSYVYGPGSMTRDDGAMGGNDLVYIPTQDELLNMLFLDNTITANGTTTTYTPQQQKEALENYISRNPYLRKHRGQYAERNGSRLPFTHSINLRIMQQFTIRINGHNCRLQLSYDLYNAANLLNRDWGHHYFSENDQYRLLEFTGYTSAASLVPQYRFNPNSAQPFNISTTTRTGNTSRWVSQLGISLLF